MKRLVTGIVWELAIAWMTGPILARAQDAVNLKVNVDKLPPGTKVIVDGYQAKNGLKRANGRDLTFPDGRKLFLGSSGTGAPYELTPNDQKVAPKK